MVFGTKLVGLIAAMIIASACTDRGIADSTGAAASTGKASDSTSVATDPGQGQSDSGAPDATSGDDETNGSGGVVEDSGADDPPEVPWSQECIDGVAGDPLTSDAATSLLVRLDDEIAHHTGRVLDHAVRVTPKSTAAFDYDDALDFGALDASGTVMREAFGSFVAVHELHFTCYTGGHGAFGPSALDGMVVVTVRGVVEIFKDYTVEVSGAVRLGGGMAFEPTVPAVVEYAVETLDDDPTYTGTLGTYAVVDLLP